MQYQVAQKHVRSASPEWHAPTVAGGYARHLIDVMASRGIDMTSCLAEARITEAQLAALDARISPLAYGALVTRALLLSHDDALGFDVGLRMTPLLHGSMGLYGLSCATGEDALMALSRYFQVASPFVTMRVTLVKDMYNLKLQTTRNLGPATAFVLQCAVAGLYRACCVAFRQPEPDDFQLHMSGPQPHQWHKYQHLMPPTSFGHVHCGALVRRAFVQAPLLMSSELAARKAQAECELELQRNAAVASFSQVVLKALKAKDGEPGYRSLVEVARALNMSSRTLSRRLEDEGQSFKALLQQRRLMDAMVRLSTTADHVEDIAGDVGYTEPANFTRAFKKWTGLTPTQFRFRSQVEG